MNEANNDGETRWLKFGDIQLFARRDQGGRPTKADAINEDESQIVRSPICCSEPGTEFCANQCLAAGASITASGRSGPRLAILRRNQFTPRN